MSVLFDFNPMFTTSYWNVPVISTIYPGATISDISGRSPFYSNTVSEGILVPGVNGNSPADSATRIIPWVIIGTNRSFYIINGSNQTTESPTIPITLVDTWRVSSNPTFPVWYIGDYKSFYQSFDYNQCIFGSNTSNANFVNPAIQTVFSPLFFSTSDLKMYRSSGRLGYSTGSFTISFLEYLNATISYFGSDLYQKLRYPRPLDGGLYLDYPKMIIDGDIAGRLFGLHIPMHRQPFGPASNLKTFEGAGDYINTTFLILNNHYGEMYIDITSDWI
jgi:hypothetical protein